MLYQRSVTQSGQIGAVPQRWISVCCLSLVLVMASLEAVHSHPSSEASRGSGSSCLICISVHSNAPALTAHVLPVLFEASDVVVACEIEAQGISSLIEFFTRPPPSA